MIRADGSGCAIRTPIAAGISYPMQEKPNSRWQVRPPVASHTFCRSPGGPPAAATMTSPARACSCSTPMIWPWVRTASVVVTTSESAVTADLSNSWSGSRASAPRDRPRRRRVPRPDPARSGLAVTPRSVTAAVSAASARLASPTMPVAPNRSASCTLTLMLANWTSGLAKMECDPVAKSVSREPTVSTTSASPARVLVAGVPSSPMPPTCHHAAVCTAPLPPKVSATGAPTAAASCSSSAVASE